MASNTELTSEYFSIIESLDGDVAGRRGAFRYMQGSTAIVHHRVVACTFVPRLFNQKTYDVMKRTAETAHGILCKVIEHYLQDPEYRRAFDFDPRLEELILLPRGYDAVLPFARLDTFLDEDSFRVMFCEFNGDGSAGMNENREIAHSIEQSSTFKEFSSRHKVFGCDLFDPWVREFLDIYATYQGRVDNPRVAVCDYLENGVVDEFYIYAERFKAAGVDCVIADVRDLVFDGEALRDGEGREINAIWRRCVTNDVIEHWDESQQLIEALRAEKVALIGSFAGHIVHDKQIFKVLFDRRTTAFLDKDEISFIEQTVPMTAFLDEGCVNLDQIRENKDEWVVKPTDHYGADDVYAGRSVDEATWRGLVDRFANGRAGEPFLVQRYVTPYKTLTLPPDANIDELADADVQTDPAPYNNINGLYVYNGRFQGVFSRLGPHPTISKDKEGITAATIWVDCDEA